MKRFWIACLLLALLFAVSVPASEAAGLQQIETVAAETTDAGVTVTLPGEYGDKGFFKLFWKNTLTGETGSEVIPSGTPEYRIEGESGAEYAFQLYYAKKRGMLPAKWKEEKTEEAPQGPAVWKVLWIEVDCVEYGGVRRQMSESNYVAAEEAAKGFEQFAEETLKGLVDIETTHLRLMEPVTSLSEYEDSGYAIAQDDIDVKRLALYKYDAVFAVARMDGIDAFYNGITLDYTGARQMPGYSFIPFTEDELPRYEADWLPCLAATEWIHQLDYYFGRYGLRICDPNDSRQYGYGDADTLEFLKDTLTMRVTSADGKCVGVPPEAWQYKPTTPPVNENLRRLQNVVSLHVRIPHVVCGPEDQPAGLILQSEGDLSGQDGRVRVDMADVFEEYPDHTGIYGVLYAEGKVSLTAGEKTVSGTGVMEFAFPGAEECSLSGTGKVWAYFLPVQYTRLSTDRSLISQPFDTAYLTRTRGGQRNLFILSDPHTYIYQDDIPFEETVYKQNFTLGPCPEGYEQYTDPVLGTGTLPFVFDTPVLTQCFTWSEDFSARDSRYARPMVRLAGTDRYELWAYADMEPAAGLPEQMDSVFAESMKLAEEQILAPGLQVDKVVAVILDEELPEVSDVDGLAVSDELEDRIGFSNRILLTAALWNKRFSNADCYVIAHELGHIVQSASLTAVNLVHTSWITEGFATWFGETVCRRIGKPVDMTGQLNETDSAEVNKFFTNLVFGVSGIESYNEHVQDMIMPDDSYTFGSLFFRYLEDVYGEGFYQKISEHFLAEWYLGYEYRFHERAMEVQYNADEYFRLIREALGEDVYTAYPAYLLNNAPKKIQPGMVSP